MKIAIIGQQDFGKAVLEAFLARGDTVAGVFVAPEKEGAKPDPMKVAAQEKGLKVFQFASLKSPEAAQAMKDLDADIGVMAFVLQFAPQEFVNIPKHGTIQYHPSLLPNNCNFHLLFSVFSAFSAFQLYAATFLGAENAPAPLSFSIFAVS